MITDKINKPLIDFSSYLLIIVYLCFGFIPNLEAVDKIAPQWLVMTITNAVALIFIFFNTTYFKQTILKLLLSKIVIVYFSFILWGALSYFYAVNSTEVLVNISRQANVFLMYFIMGMLLYQLPKKIQFTSWIVIIILGVEVYAILSEAAEMISNNNIINPGQLKGVTANRNIAAFSLAIKIPFVIYLFHFSKKIISKFIFLGLVFGSILSITMIQSRASFIACAFILFSYLVLNGYVFFKDKKLKNLSKFGLILIPFLLAIVVNQTYFSNKGANVVSRAATISLDTSDGSINKRLRYYTHVATHMLSNPILGVGLGNWKLKSIEYDKEKMTGYVVPYHAHSDFIQLGAELGVIGFSLYLGVFVLALFFAYKLISNEKEVIEKKLFIFFLIISLGVYSVDANLNFPIARPQVLVVWTLILALITIFFVKSEKNTKTPYANTHYLFYFIGGMIIIPSLYITNQVYKSHKGQMILLQDFNSNSYSLALNQVDNIVPEIPNISVTTLPISSMKARYYVNSNQYDKALALLSKGEKENPFIFYSEILKSKIYQEKGNLDSAKYYAKKSFYGLPNNALHSSTYLNLLNMTGDFEELKKIFSLITNNNDLVGWKNYLISLANVPGVSNDSISILQAKKARELFPNESDIQGLTAQIIVGQENIVKAAEFTQKGLEYFNQKDYQNSAIAFESAIEANPLEYANYENAATANYLSGNLLKGIEQIDVVINDLNPLNGKCEFIKALIFIKMGDPVGACPLLETSRDSGHSQAEATLRQYCQ